MAATVLSATATAARREGDDYVIEFGDGRELRGDRRVAGRRTASKGSASPLEGARRSASASRSCGPGSAAARRCRTRSPAHRAAHRRLRPRASRARPGDIVRRVRRTRTWGGFRVSPNGAGACCAATASARGTCAAPSASRLGRAARTSARDGRNSTPIRGGSPRELAADCFCIGRLLRAPRASSGGRGEDAATRAYAEQNGFLTLRSDGERLRQALAHPEAGEWLQQATLAIRARVPLVVLADTIQPFPTFSEIYVDALKALRHEITAASAANGERPPMAA